MKTLQDILAYLNKAFPELETQESINGSEAINFLDDLKKELEKSIRTPEPNNIKIKLFKADIKVLRDGEFEIHSNREYPHGFEVVVQLTEKSPYFQHLLNGVIIYHNVTEVHVNYDSIHKICAFESNIHSTGSTKESQFIESITINAETHKALNFAS